MSFLRLSRLIEPQLGLRPMQLHISWSLEKILLLEIQLLSLKMTIHEEMTNDQKSNLCLARLVSLDNNRLATQQNLELYQQRMSNALNKPVRLRSFQKVISLGHLNAHDHQ